MKRVMIAAACSILFPALTPVSAQTSQDLQSERSEKQKEKRKVAELALTAERVADLVSVNDDPMNLEVSMSTSLAFISNGAFTDRVRSDNFFRAFIDRKTGEAKYQLYQEIVYAGAMRRFDHANVMMPDGLRSWDLTVIAREVGSCQYGICVDTETVAIKLAEADMLAIAGLQSSSPQALLAVRYKSHTGLDWNDEIAPAEATGLLMAVDAWRKIHGFATSADN